MADSSSDRHLPMEPLDVALVADQVRMQDFEGNQRSALEIWSRIDDSGEKNLSGSAC
jgi:hypothetical protein